MADDNKISLDSSENGKLNINVSVTSKSDNSNASAAAIKSAEQNIVKSIKSLSSQEKATPKSKPASSAKNTEQLNAIITTLGALKTALDNATQTMAKSAKGGSDKPEDSIEGQSQALIQSYADKNFERGLKEALDKLNFFKEFMDKFTESIGTTLSENVEYIVKNTEKTDSPKTETATSVTGEEYTKNTSSISQVFTEEHASVLLRIADKVENQEVHTQEQADAVISEIQNMSNEVSAAQMANLNTNTSDPVLNDINAKLMKMSEEFLAANAETEDAKSKIDVSIHTEAAANNIADENAVTNVALQEVKQDMMIGDKDLTTQVQENQAFVDTQKAHMEAADQADIEEMQILDELANVEKENGAQQKEALDAAAASFEEMAKQLEGIANKPKTEADVEKKADRMISDSGNGPFDGTIVAQNNPNVVQKEATTDIKNAADTGITGGGKAVEMEGSAKEKADKEKPPAKDASTGTSGLIKAVSSIQKMISMNTLLLSKIFGALPNVGLLAANKPALAALNSSNATNTKISTAIQKDVNTTGTALVNALSQPRTINITDNSKIYKDSNNKIKKNVKGISLEFKLDFSRLTKKNDMNHHNKISIVNKGGLGGDGRTIVDILKQMLNEMKAAHDNAKKQAGQQAKEALFNKQFGNIKSGSNAGPAKGDSTGMLKGIMKAISGIGPGILKGILGAKAKMWAFLIGLIAMVVAFIWLLVKNPELRQKLWDWFKSLGGKIWGLWMKFWNQAGPKVKAAAILVITLLTLYIVGITMWPVALIVGAIMLIASLWPKYKAIIVAVVVAAIAVFAWWFATHKAQQLAQNAIRIAGMIQHGIQMGIFWAQWLIATLGPIGIIILVIVAIVALIFMFKDKIWDGLKKLGSFLVTALKWLFAWPIMLLMKFFPGLGQKLKNAIVSLFGGIPFIGKFVKKIFGAGGDAESGEEAKEEGKKKEEEYEEEEKKKKKEKSGGFFGMGGGQPAPEASGMTSYNGSASAGPVELSQEVIDKITNAIQEVKNVDTAAAAQIIATMRNSFGSSILLLVAVNRMMMPIRLIQMAAMGTLSAVRSIGMNIIGLTMAIRGMPLAISKMKLAIDRMSRSVSNTVKPIGNTLKKINRNLAAIKLKMMMSTGIGGLIDGAAGLMGKGLSMLSKTKMAQNMMSKFKDKLGIKSKTDTKNAVASVMTSNVMSVKIVDDKNSTNSLTEAKVQKEIPSRYSKVMLDGIVIDKKKYDEAVEKYGKDKVKEQPWLANRFGSGNEEHEKRNWMIEKQRVEKYGHSAFSSEGRLIRQGKVYDVDREVNARIPAPKTPKKIETAEASANAANATTLVNQKNSIENIKTQNQQNKIEKQQIAATEQDDKTMKTLNMLPKIIAVGLANYFDNRELTLKGSSTDNVLAIKNDDKASDF